MTATLDSIDTAIFNALDEVSRPNGDTFSYTGRYAGELAKPDQVFQEFLQRAPACLICFHGETGRNDAQTQTGEAETESTSTWEVLVCTTDVRSTTIGLKGAVGANGAYALASAVHSTLNNLVIDGLIRGERLRYVRTRPITMQRGKCYILGVQFTAARAAEVVTSPDNSVQYYGTIGNIHLEDTVDPVPPDADPIDVFTDAY